MDNRIRKFTGLLCCIILFAATAYAAPTGGIKGNIIDGTDSSPLVGALVEVEDLSGDDDRQFMAEREGRFHFTGLAAGKYRIKISYLGFEDYTKEVNVGNQTVDLGTIRMEQATEAIEQVVFEVPAMRTSQRGDTVAYNAAAFKVAADSDTENLLAKMPGIIISSDGSVEAQGEEVQKIFVDGKEFFGDDVSTAIKNLPAEVVESVEVFNKLSDQAEFTGLDDGEGYKAINIVTSQDKRRGVFGKLYAAYGYPEYYTGGGNVNIFNGDSRISIIGMANNLNQQNFSFEDILGVVDTGGSSSGGGSMGRHGGRGVGGFLVRPMDGISTVQAIGTNYSDTWGKRDNVEVTASYFFNHSRNRNVYTNEVWQEDSQLDATQYEYVTGKSNADNYNHRFNARLDYKISDAQNLMLRAWFSQQDYSETDSYRTDIDSIRNTQSTDIKSILNSEDSKRTGYNTGLFALYRVRLGKPGRTLTVNMNGNYSKNNSTRLIEEYTYLKQYIEGNDPDEIGNQNIFGDTYSYRIGGGVTYTEPINQKSQLNLEYRVNYNYSDAQSLTYLYDPLLEIINPELSEELSTINNSGYLTQSVGPGYRFSNGKTNLSASLMYQYSLLDNVTELPVREQPDVKYRFNNLVYSVMGNFNFNPQNTLRIHARSYTRNPSITQLQDVPDMSDATDIQGGNPALRPAYNHNINAHFINSNTTKGQTFTIMLGAQYTTDYIGDSIVTYNASRPFIIPGTQEELQPAQRYTRYANIGNSWMVRAGLSYGLPIRFLASNLTFNVGASFAQTPNIMDGAKFTMNESYYNGGIQLSSNISENIDFTISYNGSYNIAKGLSNGRSTDNRFIEQYAAADLKWVFWKGFTLTASASYNQYRGITNSYNEEYVLCNLYIGKKLFRNQLGEISIGVNDLLDQNKSFRRTVRNSYIENTTSLAIGRYVAVQFVYNLRSFKNSASKAASGYDNFDKPGNVGVQSGNRRPGPGMPPPPHR